MICLRLGLAYRKERKCSWLERKQLENCLGKQKVNEGNKKKKKTYKEVRF